MTIDWIAWALANAAPRPKRKPQPPPEPDPAAEPVRNWDGSTEGGEDPNAHAELVRLSEWGVRPLTWLWEPLIPRGKVTLLVSEQGAGKTFFAADLAARLSRGESIPPAGRLDDGPAGTLFLYGDDDFDDALLPRLDGMGADLDRISALMLHGPRWRMTDRPQISLADSVECLYSAARRIGDCRLIVIDPITAYLEGMRSGHGAVRRLLSRLTLLAKMRNAAVLIVSHNRKAKSGDVLHHTIGSLAFTAAARVVLTLVDDPAIPDRHLLLPAKMNLLPIARCPGRAFSLEEGELRWDPEPVAARPDELQRLTAKGLDASQRMLDVAEQLRTLLMGGPIASVEVHAWAAAHRIPRLLLLDAKVLAGVQSKRDGRNWRWELVAPPAANHAPRQSSARCINQQPPPLIGDDSSVGQAAA